MSDNLRIMNLERQLDQANLAIDRLTLCVGHLAGEAGSHASLKCAEYLQYSKEDVARVRAYMRSLRV